MRLTLASSEFYSDHYRKCTHVIPQHTIALVTGSSRGIGRAVAVRLAADGADVIGVHYATDAEAGEETAEQVAAAGAKPVLLQADLAVDAPRTAASLATSFLDEVERLTGERTVDVLVNNAGIGGPQSLGTIDADTYQRVIDVNLTAPIFLIQALAPHIRHGGRVVNVSTGYTRIAAPTHPVYAAAKAALNTLGLALAPTLAANDVTINAVMPGVIDTDMNADWLDEAGARDHAAQLSVFGRVGTVDDVAQLVGYLASEGARWTTGQVIDVTGGSAL